jgi:hypothetical protein
MGDARIRRGGGGTASSSSPWTFEFEGGVAASAIGGNDDSGGRRWSVHALVCPPASCGRGGTNAADALSFRLIANDDDTAGRRCADRRGLRRMGAGVIFDDDDDDNKGGGVAVAMGGECDPLLLDEYERDGGGATNRPSSRNRRSFLAILAARIARYGLSSLSCPHSSSFSPSSSRETSEEDDAGSGPAALLMF